MHVIFFLSSRLYTHGMIFLLLLLSSNNSSNPHHTIRNFLRANFLLLFFPGSNSNRKKILYYVCLFFIWSFYCVSITNEAFYSSGYFSFFANKDFFKINIRTFLKVVEKNSKKRWKIIENVLISFQAFLRLWTHIWMSVSSCRRSRSENEENRNFQFFTCVRFWWWTQKMKILKLISHVTYITVENAIKMDIEMKAIKKLYYLSHICMCEVE
jgi:hypothetical protein